MKNKIFKILKIINFKMEKQTYTIFSGDGQYLQISKNAIIYSTFLRGMLEENIYDGGNIILQNLSGKSLKYAIEFCEHRALYPEESYKNTDDAFEITNEWDNLFLAKISKENIFELYSKTSNFLEIKELFNILAQHIADLLSGRTEQEMQKMLEKY